MDPQAVLAELARVPLGPEPDEVGGEALQRLVLAGYGIDRFIETVMSRVGEIGRMSGSRIRALFVVGEAGSLRMGDLAARLGVAPRTVTDLADSLEREGWLVRRPDPHDRRATLIELSPRAREHWAATERRFRQMGEWMLRPLSAEERRQLLALLTKLMTGPIGDYAAVPRRADDWTPPRPPEAWLREDEAHTPRRGFGRARPGHRRSRAPWEDAGG